MRRPRGARPRGTPVDIVVESTLWNDRRGVKTLLRRAIAEAGEMLSTSNVELAIVLTDDSAIRRLNRQWRGKDEPTNVLAFPAIQPHLGRGTHRVIGDIVIAIPTPPRIIEGRSVQKLEWTVTRS